MDKSFIQALRKYATIYFCSLGLIFENLTGIKHFIVRELIRLKPSGTIHRWEKILSIKNMTMRMVFVLQALLG